MSSGRGTGGAPLSEVSVRPAAGGAERAEWDCLMDAHHYLGFRCLIGGGFGMWRRAGAGWQCGAFKVKERDAWIGWASEQQFRRLRLVANNTRFPDPAGRTGAEPRRCRCRRGVCRRTWRRRWASGAAGGDVRGSVALRVDVLPGVELDRAGQPARTPYSRCWSADAGAACGNSLATALTLSAAARLTGTQGPTAIAEFAARLTRRQLVAARAFRSPASGRLVPPSKSCVHRVLSELDPDALGDAAQRVCPAMFINDWLAVNPLNGSSVSTQAVLDVVVDDEV